MASNYYTEVISIVRKPLHIKHDKLKQVVVDFQNLSQHADVFEVSDVYICLGTTIKKAKSKGAFKKVDLNYPTEIAKLAHMKGAKRLAVISALGANEDSNFFYNRVKGKMEQAIESVPFKGTYIFRPSLLLGSRNEFRFGERMGIAANEIFKHVMLGSLSKYKGIKAEKVAQAMFMVTTAKKKGLHYFESNEIRKMTKKALERRA
ncbi:MAG: oxidoreductase [Bacteroidetes bacterium]|nr:oxidoreductase [Bacteroidota bacterium]